MEVGERIRYLRNKLGITQDELAQKVGYKSRSSINKIEMGIRDITQSAIVAFSKALNVTPAYLMGWEDENVESNIEILPNSKVHMIPVFETVSAGFGTYADNCIVDYMPLFIANVSDVPDMMCIRVSGDSMYPKIEDGDTIVVRRQPCVDNGQIAVVLIDGEEGVVKKINAGENFIELISINPMYPPRIFEDEELERISIVGLVRQIIKNV